MNKQMFLEELSDGLSSLPPGEREERLMFYDEMIDDHIEEGLSEEEAVAAVGAAGEIAARITADVSAAKPLAENAKPKRRLKTWQLVLLIVGFPVWFPLLTAAAAIVFSLYVALWALVISLWAFDVTLMAAAFGGIASAVLFFVKGHWVTGLAALGLGFLCAGFSIFLFFGCKSVTKGTAKLAKKIVLGIKSLFTGREEAK